MYCLCRGRRLEQPLGVWKALWPRPSLARVSTRSYRPMCSATARIISYCICKLKRCVHDTAFCVLLFLRRYSCSYPKSWFNVYAPICLLLIIPCSAGPSNEQTMCTFMYVERGYLPSTWVKCACWMNLNHQLIIVHSESVLISFSASHPKDPESKTGPCCYASSHFIGVLTVCNLYLRLFWAEKFLP